MVKEIGIRELKAHASEVVRAVKEQGARYLITRHGRPMAIILPVEAEVRQEKADTIWARLEELGKEIAADWQSEKSAVEILTEMRR